MADKLDSICNAIIKGEDGHLWTHSVPLEKCEKVSKQVNHFGQITPGEQVKHFDLPRYSDCQDTHAFTNCQPYS
jgi:hypothetical protein